MKRIASLLLLLGLSACSTPRAPLVSEIDEAVPEGEEVHKPSKGLTPEQLKDLEVEIGEYRLGAGDAVELYCMDVPELSRKYVLGPDGKLTVPNIGVLSLDGLSRDQASIKIQELLKNTYRSPHVDVIVDEYNNNRVSVLGEVRWPGQYNFPGQPMLLDALARAQGLTEKADMRGCTIVRGKGTLIEINLYDLLRKGDRTLNIPLLPNDSVFVRADEDHTFYVFGEVAHPGVFPRTQNEDAVHAIAVAGGETHDAQMSKVKIIRRNKAGHAAVIDVDMDKLVMGYDTDDPPIQDSDIVYVPRKGVATFNYYLNQITPSMNTIMMGYMLEQLKRSSTTGH